MELGVVVIWDDGDDEDEVCVAELVDVLQA